MGNSDAKKLEAAKDIIRLLADNAFTAADAREILVGCYNALPECSAVQSTNIDSFDRFGDLGFASFDCETKEDRQNSI